MALRLSRARTRVERLATAMQLTALADCAEQHEVTHYSFRSKPTEPVPEWPPKDAPTHCRNGHHVEYTTSQFRGNRSR
jgi:hypothetical protein